MSNVFCQIIPIHLISQAGCDNVCTDMHVHTAYTNTLALITVVIVIQLELLCEKIMPVEKHYI